MSQLAKSAALDSEAASALDPEAVADLPENRTPRRNPFRKIVAIVLLAAGLLWAARYVSHLLTYAETDDAYVTGYVHEVSPHIGGTVAEVLVEQDSSVKAGDVLFRLDPRDSEAKVRQAEAQLAQADAFIALAKAQIADSTAKVDQAQAQDTKATLDFEREQELVRTKVASKQEFDSSKAAFDSAGASLIASKASLQ